MGLVTAIQSEKTGGTGGSEEPSVTSDSLKLLQKGYAASEERNRVLSERWQAKQSAAGKVLRCKKCGRTFKNKLGIGAHFRSRRNECKAEHGYEEIPDVAPTAADRMTEDEASKASLVARATEAARKARDEVMGAVSRPSVGGLDAATLMKLPIIAMQSKLRTVDSEQLRQFIQMKFHVNNASKRFLAVQELQRRGEQAE